jgi:DNA-binding MarR family transcriptional regulator
VNLFVTKKANSQEAARLKPQAAAVEPAPMFDLIELMFFAYRDFVQDADRLLENYGFGRAHHRVLHFVSRQPGLTIAELLDILKITKQSLNRVLKELLGKGYVEVSMGVNDRRQRLLYPTATGTSLALEIACLQSRRFNRVLEQLPEGAREAAFDFLLAMVDAGERDKVARFIAVPSPAVLSKTRMKP